MSNRSAVEASKREGVEGMYVSCKGMASPWEIFTARRNASAACAMAPCMSVCMRLCHESEFYQNG